ncbi:hypothetical protein DPMN_120872 [Dreissena polymorpha]|uniref:Uncharacterized protein n=1 Tax=Dreissena polymorpha TaxID=45954 RepID=A0A9D4JQJ6_DREPO|nr:hypothetical protein DPMN_120872 [Dreissena polymorpha]
MDPPQGALSGLTVDKLAQVPEGAVGRLSGPGDNMGADPRCRQPGQPPRYQGQGEYPEVGPYPQNRGYGDQRQVRYPEVAGGGGPRGNRYQNAYERGPGPNAYGRGGRDRYSNPNPDRQTVRPRPPFRRFPFPCSCTLCAVYVSYDRKGLILKYGLELSPRKHS